MRLRWGGPAVSFPAEEWYEPVMLDPAGHPVCLSRE
jgi:hypothetical protein